MLSLSGELPIINFGFLKDIAFLSQIIMFNLLLVFVCLFFPFFVCVLQLLWSFCSSVLEEAETRPFRLTHESPGPSRSLDYDSQSTFEELGLANSMISVTWDEEDFVWEWD